MLNQLGLLNLDNLSCQAVFQMQRLVPIDMFLKQGCRFCTLYSLYSFGNYPPRMVPRDLKNIGFQGVAALIQGPRSTSLVVDGVLLHLQALG